LGVVYIAGHAFKVNQFNQGFSIDPPRTADAEA